MIESNVNLYKSNEWEETIYSCRLEQNMTRNARGNCRAYWSHSIFLFSLCMSA